MDSSAANASPAVAVRDRFAQALRTFDRARPVRVLGHNDADGLSAIALLTRALRSAGWIAEPRIVGRGESPWSADMRDELAAAPPAGGLIVADLGVRAFHPAPGTPTVVVDHHVPQGEPEGAVVISGHGWTPEPTTSLLAYWCAGAVADPDAWLWLAALGLIGDMAEGAGFPEMGQARRYGITALREATSLVNAPRRTGSGDASAALDLLLAADGPKAIVAAPALHAAKAEVKRELDAAKRVAPRVRDGAALVLFSSPAQIHPLVAQQWRGRLKDEVVLAANAGYRPGWVHFAARTARDLDLVAWLAERRPPGADEMYGSGHRQATGGALRAADWNHFVRALGFGPEAEVAQEATKELAA